MEFNFFKKKEKEQRNCQCQPSYYGEGLLYSQIYNQSPAMSLSAVFRCVDLISNSIAMLPIKIKQTTEYGVEEVKTHPLNLIFNNKTNNLMTKYDMIKMTIQNILNKGNGYLYIERGQSGIITNLRYLDSGDVLVTYDKEKNRVYYKCSLVSPKYIEPKDMLHFKIHSYDGINGVSVLNYASRSIAIAHQTENTAKNYFSNGCLLSGIITYQGRLDDAQRQQIRESWANTYGTNGNGGVAVLGQSMSYQPISSSASDTQMLESRLYNTQDICRFFGVNPVLIGELSHSSYGSIEAIQQDFLVHTLQPIITMMEEEMNKKLFNDNDSLEINIDENYILRSDKTASSSYYSTLVNIGVLSRNEVRKELGYNSVEGGDTLTVSYSDINQNQINNTENTEQDGKENN